MLKSGTASPVRAKDIAREVGLSQPTVSRILSGANCRVAAKTRARVLEVAQAMGYQPNALARSLRQKRTNVLGLYTGYGYIDARNSFLAGLIGGLQRAADQHRVDILLHGTFRGGSTEDIYGELVDGRIDGLFIHTHAGDPLVARLRDSRLPTIALTDAVPGVPSVVCDDADGVERLVEHLWNKGHRQIAFLSPEQHFTSVEIRRNAFLKIMDEKGVPSECCPVLIIRSEDAAPALQRMLSGTRTPTAVCCWNDTTAMRLLQACRETGVRVPEDLAVTGFDGLLEPWLMARRLVTIRANWEDITARAMQDLMGWIETGTPAGLNEVTCLPVALVEGDTV